MEASLAQKLVQNRPTISASWNALKNLPAGPQIFSKMIGALAPYTGSVGATVTQLSDGHSEVQLTDRKKVRNHLNCVHAIALMNLGEMATGLAVLYSVDGRGKGIIRKLEMEYLKKARGTITATCDTSVPAGRGSYDAGAQAYLRNERGEVVAIATATWKVTID